MDGCPHCAALGEDRLWEGERFRVVLAHEAGFPGWVRVIWNAHTAELTDLPGTDRRAFLEAVMIVEEVLRSELQPRKINLASLGTAIPHLHVHIIPRFEGDATFPNPVWLPPIRAFDRELPTTLRQTMRGRLDEMTEPRQASA